jgi:hypothetical protein
MPVFAPVRPRTRATIANDDGPAGLSARITPVGSSAFGIGISPRVAVRGQEALRRSGS